MSNHLEKATEALLDELERQTEVSGYVAAINDDPRTVILDGWFDITKLAQVVLDLTA